MQNKVLFGKKNPGSMMQERNEIKSCEMKCSVELYTESVVLDSSATPIQVLAAELAARAWF